MNKTKTTKTNASTGRKMEKREITNAVPVSMVETNEFPNPAVDTVDVTRVAPAALFMVAAVPPPAIMAKAQEMMGFKSATVDTITAVPAMLANGMAIVSSKLSTNGI